MSRRGPGGGRGGSRGLRIAGVLAAALAAVLAILSEQGGLDWGPWREAPAPAESPAPPAPADRPERDREPTPASLEEADSGAGAGLSELFPAPGELREVRETLARIAAGGPFPYRKDGSVFRNREGRLPRRPSGYYREYTVETPGEDDRGARRIVQGRDGDTWYTRDHYGSFVHIDPEEVLGAP